MRTTKITYWTATIIVSLMMVFSAYSYLTSPDIKQAFVHLGFPGYFRVELAIAKILGAVLLLAPVAARFKEWAYVGFAIVFVSAFVAHISSADAAGMGAMPLIFLAILVTSYIAWHKLTDKSPALARN
jgi:uncharacterized membrane protein YphA (DoxX/SURF4 family)